MERAPLESALVSSENRIHLSVAEQVTLQILPVWEHIFPERQVTNVTERQALASLTPVRLCVPVDITIAGLEEQIRQAYFPRCCENLQLSAESIAEALGRAHILYSGTALDPQSTLRALRIASGTTLRWRTSPVADTTSNASVEDTRRSDPRISATNRLETRVYRLEPNTGLTSGGSRVLVFGNHFPAVARVRFGHIIVHANRHSAQCLECIAPAHEPGVVNVEVTVQASQEHRPDIWTQDRITYTYVGYERLSMILAVHAAERRAAVPLASTTGACRPTESLSWNRHDSDHEDRNQH
ncbi:hypothetical protein CCYA_CCYA03G1084 [Cyanidiococcus yangmingshanensis]|nr:hypothetical protein CCYA_CCYA03G1084 [Cyanidiococcus yangmingshanensis]